MSAKTASDESSAARAVFSRMGLTHVWQAALLLPASYTDIRPVHRATDLSEAEPAALTFRVAGPVSTSGSGGVPRATLAIQDAAGDTCRATIFGNAREWANKLKIGECFTFLATGKHFAGEWRLTLKEPVEAEYVGKVRPTYPLRRCKQTPALVRAIVRAHIPAAMPQAVAFVGAQLEKIASIERILADIGCPGWTLAQLIEQVHAPANLQYAEHARGAYLKLAALGALARLHYSQPEQPAAPIRLTTLRARADTLSITLTDDQRNAVREIAALLNRPVAMRAILSGEVGSGKTIAASLIAAGVIDADARNRVLVMAPNATIATQFRKEFSEAFPDIASVLVTAESDPGEEALQARMVFGTSAVLFRDLGRFDLAVVDEQHKWSRSQREHYVAADTHLLEMSATCIPRSQALVKYGRVSLLQMRSYHAKKNIVTRLWEGPEQTKRLMRGIASVIEQGRPVIVVYPKCEVSGDDATCAAAIDDRHSIEAAIPRWEKAFPGRVRAITGDNLTEEKRAAIQDLEEGRASILLATSVIETGVTIKGLRNIVIAHPERHGLTSLHQFRGRLARHGGDGFCELLVFEPLSEKARARLNAVMSTTDGFKLSELDLQLRGTGDMGANSETQSGADQTFLFGVPLSVELIEQVQPLWAGYLQAQTQ